MFIESRKIKNLFIKSSVIVLLSLTMSLTGCRNPEYVDYPYPQITNPEISLENKDSNPPSSEDVQVNFYYDNTRSGTYYVANRDTELIQNEDEKKIVAEKINDPSYVNFNNFFQALLINTNQSYNNKSYILQETDGFYRWSEYSGGIFNRLGDKELYTFDAVSLPSDENGRKKGPVYMLVYDDVVDWNNGINVIFTDLAEQYCRNIDLAQTIKSKLNDDFSACVLSTEFTYTGELSVPTIDSADALSPSQSINADRAYHLIITGQTDALRKYTEKLTDNLRNFGVEYDITSITDYSQFENFTMFELSEDLIQPAENLDNILEDKNCEIEDEDIPDIYTNYVYNFEQVSEFNVKRNIFQSEDIVENILAYSYLGGTTSDYVSLNLELNMEDEQIEGGVVSYRIGDKDEISCFYAAVSEDENAENKWIEMDSSKKFNAFEHLETNGKNILIATNFENTPPISNAYYVRIPVYEKNQIESAGVPEWCSKYDADTADKIYTSTFQYTEFIKNLILENDSGNEKCVGYITILFDELPFK